METFFLVSGFLACMIRSRKGKKVFFQARIKRVLLPLLLGCFGGNLLLQIFGAYYMDFAWKNFDL
ncbi:acyltransferase family protein [Suttonella indologenes]|uniref:Glucans biosynthesis protein n=1 Tax=Suttonella indologenes TaxID=13276 RepID=A0A380N2Q8_9GAMM|nr:acyltransferase family protein [Suttonella indologenes]SUO98077.1 glucans biosynthesis protein [Suttonella indologenes]